MVQYFLHSRHISLNKFPTSEYTREVSSFAVPFALLAHQQPLPMLVYCHLQGHRQLYIMMVFWFPYNHAYQSCVVLHWSITLEYHRYKGIGVYDRTNSQRVSHRTVEPSARGRIFTIAIVISPYLPPQCRPPLRIRGHNIRIVV